MFRFSQQDSMKYYTYIGIDITDRYIDASTSLILSAFQFTEQGNLILRK